MNRDMSDTMRRLLTNAYVLRGMDDVAAEIIAETGIETSVFGYYGPTYGSALRDEAMYDD